MTDAAQSLMTVDDFLVAYEGREGKWELDDGIVVGMASEQFDHGRTKASTWLALRDAIRRAKLPCEAIIDSVAVRISARTAYIPDALVYCGPRLPDDTREAPAPLIVVEVVSPSTERRDERRKFVGYFSLPSVRHYLTVDPRDRSVFHHRRDDDGRIETRLLESGAMKLDPPGLELAVEDMFAQA